jgi:hypothetical protein
LSRRDVPSQEAETIAQVYAIVRAGHTARVTNDVERALGRAPRRFEQFAADYADRWRRN